MNLRVLQYLIAVADTKHFGQAAQLCFVSQPTLSMQIKKFEEQLGIQIFERDNKSVMLTAIGAQIVAQARKINLAAAELKQIAESVKNPLSGHINIGIIPTLGPYLLPKIVPHLAKTLPELTLQFTELQTHDLINQTLSGDIDLLILALPVNETRLQTKVLFKETFYLAVPSKHPLTNKKTVKINDVAAEPMLLLHEGHCLRDHALDVCQNNKRFTEHDFQATSLETLRQMISAGVGITLIPEFALQKSDKNIQYIPFKNPAPARSIGIAWRETSSRTFLFDKIAEIITNKIQ